MVSELAVLQASSSLSSAQECGSHILAAVNLAVLHFCTLAVDVAVKALCRVALASAAMPELPFPDHLFLGAVTPALQLAREHLCSLMPSTWRLVLMVLLRLER